MGVTSGPDGQTERQLERLRATALLTSVAQRMDRARLRATEPYLLGHLVVDLRRPSGWRVLPARLTSLVGRVRRRGAPDGRVRLPSQEAPRQPGVALVAARDSLVTDLEGGLGIVPADPAWFDHQFLDVDLVVAEHGPAHHRRRSPRARRRLFEMAERRGVRRVVWDSAGTGPLSADLAATADVIVAGSSVRAAELTGSHPATPVVVVPGIVDPRRGRSPGRTAVGPLDIRFTPRWTPDRRPVRISALDELLLGAAGAGALTIMDDSVRRRRRLRYPSQVSPAVSLSSGRTGDASRASVLLHAHPSPDRIDPSLFAALASRIPVVSVPHRGVEEVFGSDVPMPAGRAAIDAVLADLLDPTVRDRTAHLGWRRVMGAHTAEHVAGRILRAGGLPSIDDSTPSVDVIISTNRPEQIGFALDNVRRQIHPRVRLLFVAHGDGFEIPDLRNRLAEFSGSRLIEMPATCTLGECLNVAIDAGEGDWFAKFDDDDWYGPHYLSDMLLARRATDSAVLGKRTVYMHFQSDDTTVLRHPDKEFARIGLVAGPTLLVDRARLGPIRFPALNVGEDTGFLAACSAAELRPFSTDRFNFVQVRRANPASHTWEVDEAELRRDSVPVGSGLRLDVAWV